MVYYCYYGLFILFLLHFTDNGESSKSNKIDDKDGVHVIKMINGIYRWGYNKDYKYLFIILFRDPPEIPLTDAEIQFMKIEAERRQKETKPKKNKNDENKGKEIELQMTSSNINKGKKIDEEKKEIVINPNKIDNKVQKPLPVVLVTSDYDDTNSKEESLESEPSKTVSNPTSSPFQNILSKSPTPSSDGKRPALNNMSFMIEKGSLTMIIGGVGSGKSSVGSGIYVYVCFACLYI